MIRKYPQLRGKVDLLVENEIKSAIDALYDVIENLAQKANVSLEVNTPNSPSATQRNSSTQNAPNRAESGVGLQNDTFSQPLLNQGQVLQTALQAVVPKSVLKSDLVNTAGVFPVAGKITLQTLDGKSVEVLTP